MLVPLAFKKKKAHSETKTLERTAHAYQTRLGDTPEIASMSQQLWKLVLSEEPHLSCLWVNLLHTGATGMGISTLTLRLKKVSTFRCLQIHETQSS